MEGTRYALRFHDSPPCMTPSDFEVRTCRCGSTRLTGTVISSLRIRSRTPAKFCTLRYPTLRRSRCPGTITEVKQAYQAGLRLNFSAVSLGSPVNSASRHRTTTSLAFELGLSSVCQQKSKNHLSELRSAKERIRV